MTPKHTKAKTKPKPKVRATGGRPGRTGLWTAAGVAPLAIGLAMGSPPAPTPPEANVGHVPVMSQLIAATDSVPRLLLLAPSEEVRASWDKPRPNKSTLGSCSWFGNDNTDSVTNQRKDRTDLPPSYHAVTFDAIAELEWPREASTHRRTWSDSQLAMIAPYEGEAVTVTGFVAVFSPQKYNSESANCDAHGEDSTDWHIGLVGRFGEGEAKAVVVETTPRIKLWHPNWQEVAIKAIVAKRDSIRVSGYLMLDPVHKPHLNVHRQTLWEVHPIHRIEIFQNGTWRDLDGG